MSDGNNNIELSVRSQLEDIIADFDKLKAKSDDLQNALKQSGDVLEENFASQGKRVETFMSKMRSVASRATNQIKNDFKALASIELGREALNLSNQFRGSIKDSVTLSDTIRKLGLSFGIAQKDFDSFQNRMTKGLGKIGLDSKVAANTMEGLADAPVKGEEALIQYSKVSGQLASIAGQSGQEGAIAKGISDVILARGGDPNSIQQINAVAEDLRRLRQTTGKTPTDSLKTMQGIFSSMSQDMRNMLSTRGMANIAAASQVAGPSSEAFFKEILGKSKIERLAFEQQGFKDVFTDQGLDLDKFEKAAQNIISRVGGDPRKGAETLGLSGAAAEGFVRLTEKMKELRKAQQDINNSTGDLTTTYKQSRGLGEAFRANINRVKSGLTEILTPAISGATDFLNKTSESGAGSTALVAGGGILASLMAGGALRGIGKGLGGFNIGGMIKKEALSEITGQDIQSVYVVNAGEIGGAFPTDKISGMFSKNILGFLGKAGLVGAAGFAGYKVGEAIYEHGPTFEGTTSEGYDGPLIERFFAKMESFIGTERAKRNEEAARVMKTQKIIVESKDKDLKVTKNSRGANY